LIERNNVYPKIRILVYISIIMFLSLVITVSALNKPVITETGTPRISSRLQDNITQYQRAEIGANEELEIIIRLEGNPPRQVISKIKEEYEPDIKNYSAKIKDVLKKYKPRNLTPLQEEEHSLDLYQRISQEDRDKIKDLARAKNQLKTQLRNDIEHNLSISNAKIQEPLLEEIQSKEGDIINNFLISNIIIARIKVGEVIGFLNDSRIEGIGLNVKESGFALDISPGAIVASSLQNDYSGGNGPEPLATISIIDSGINISHPNLKYLSDGSTLRTWYNKSYDGEATNDVLNHGTLIAGIIASSNDTYRGVMYNISSMINVKLDEDGDEIDENNMIQAMNWSLWDAPDQAEVISLSVGKDKEEKDGTSLITTDYDTEADVGGATIVVAAGNKGNTGSKNLTQPGDGYNVITVGAMDDKNTTNRDDDVWGNWSISASGGASGRGPTGDGRKKPDIMAPGVAIKSANASGEFSIAKVGGGTSFAVPHVSAASAWFDDVLSNTLEIKALLINTARDYGDTGWDEYYGWGSVNLGSAHTYIDNTWYESSFTDDGVRLYKLTNVDNGDTSTLVWFKHQGESLHDIDLYLYDESDGNTVDSSTSGIDNVEQVATDTNYDNIVLKVNSADVWTGNEEFAVATETDTDFTINPPALSASLSNPSGKQEGQLFNISAQITPTGDLNAHGVSVTLNLPSGLTLISGANPRDLETINDGSSKTAVWTVNATEEGAKNFNVSITSSSYGETYNANASSSVAIASAYNLYINIKTLKDDYTSNEFVNITDPPEENNTNQSSEEQNTTANSTAEENHPPILILLEKSDLLPTDEGQKYGAVFDEIINEDGSRTRTMYGSTRNIEEGGGWKRVEKARSLMDKGVFELVYLENDSRYDLEIVDFNYTSITFKPIIKDENEMNKDIPVKINGAKKTSVNYNSLSNKQQLNFKFNDTILGKNLTVGEHSTTVTYDDTSEKQGNQLSQSNPSTTYQVNSPDFYDEVGVQEDSAAIRFGNGSLNWSNKAIVGITLSFYVDMQDYSQADGYVEVYYYDGPYNPSNLTWNIQPGRGLIYQTNKMSGTSTYTMSSNDIDHKEGCYGDGYCYYHFKGKEDLDDIVAGEILVNNANTYLQITYVDCDQNSDCVAGQFCNSTGYCQSDLSNGIDCGVTYTNNMSERNGACASNQCSLDGRDSTGYVCTASNECNWDAQIESNGYYQCYNYAYDTDTGDDPRRCDGGGTWTDAADCPDQTCVTGSGSTPSYLRDDVCDAGINTGGGCKYGPTVKTCDYYVTCDGTTCPTSCSSQSDCTDNAYCDGICKSTESKIINNGESNVSIYLLMKIQYYNGSGFVDEAIIQNDTSPRTVNINQTLKLDAIWNPNAWNTSNNGNGTYRVWVAATDENDNLLAYNQTEIVAMYNFTILPPDFNKFTIKNTSGSNMAWLGDSGNAVIKGILEQNSAHTRNADFAFIIRNNGEDVLIIENDGNMYIDGTLFQNQSTISSSLDDTDFRIRKDGEWQVVVNESGYVFMKGTLTQNGAP